MLAVGTILSLRQIYRLCKLTRAIHTPGSKHHLARSFGHIDRYMHRHLLAWLHVCTLFATNSHRRHRLYATTLHTVGSEQNLRIFYPVVGGLRRSNATFHPVAHIQQGLIKHSRIIHHLGRIILATMRTAVGVPQTEVIVRSVAQVFSHMLAVPVALPGISLPVPHRAAKNHLAVNLARWQYARSRLGDNRAQQHRTLRIDRQIVEAAELIPRIIVLGWHLVTIVSLGSQPVAVVHLHLVALTHLRQQLRIIDGSQYHILPFRTDNLQLVALALAREQHQFATQGVHLYLFVYLKCHRLFLHLGTQTCPRTVGTASVGFRHRRHDTQLFGLQLPDGSLHHRLGLHMITLQ